MLVAGIGAEARLVIVGTRHRLEYYGLDELSASYTWGSMFLTSGRSRVSQAVQRLQSPAEYAR